MEVRELTAVQIREYFGMKPGQSMLEFAKEIKALSPEEKEEIVNLAAAQLGVTVKQV